MALNVLIIDDSAVMRAMVIKTLRLSGVPVGDLHQASNGQEALEALSDNWVDLALLDLNMPVMNGEEFLERVRENPETRDLKVVVVSTESSETRIDRLREQGAEFVHKPFTPEQLREKVVNVTGVDDERALEGVSDADDGTDF